MKRRHRSAVRNVFTIALLAAGAAFAAGLEEADIEAAIASITSGCTAEHGYDRDATDDLGDHELGPGEKAWRRCVYAGIRSELAPRSSVPDQYEQIIRDDMEFTRAIEAGEMTRHERWQRIRESRAAIIATEQLAADTGVQADEADAEQRRLEQFRMRTVQNALRSATPRVPRGIR